MRHGFYIHPSVSSETLIPKDDVKVSARSFFFDDEWDFTEEQGDPSLSICHKVIKWDFDITGTRKSSDPEYAEMLLAMKQLAYFMLYSLERKPISVTARVLRWASLIKFMADRPFPVFRFRDILESDLKEYLSYLKSRKGRGDNVSLSPATITHHLSCLNLLHDFKDHLVDYLEFRPSGKTSPNKAAGFKEADALANRTQAIPDMELKGLIEYALKCVYEKAPVTIKCLEELFTFARKKKGKLTNISISESDTNDFFKSRADCASLPDLIKELRSLRSACFTLEAVQKAVA